MYGDVSFFLVQGDGNGKRKDKGQERNVCGTCMMALGM